MIRLRRKVDRLEKTLSEDEQAQTRVGVELLMMSQRHCLSTVLEGLNRSTTLPTDKRLAGAVRPNQKRYASVLVVEYSMPPSRPNPAFSLSRRGSSLTPNPNPNPNPNPRPHVSSLLGGAPTPSPVLTNRDHAEVHISIGPNPNPNPNPNSNPNTNPNPNPNPSPNPNPRPPPRSTKPWVAAGEVASASKRIPMGKVGRSSRRLLPPERIIVGEVLEEAHGEAFRRQLPTAASKLT